MHYTFIIRFLFLLSLVTQPILAAPVTTDSLQTQQRSIQSADDCIVPQNLHSDGGTSTTAFLGWNTVVGTAIRYRVRWRSSGSATWIDRPVTPNPYDKLTGLTNGVTYEAQVQTICSEQPTPYSGSITFTTACSLPDVVTVYEVTRTSALMVWGEYGTEPVYEIQWRPRGISTWPNSLTVSGTSYSFSNLTPETTYEYRLRTLCNDGNVSDYCSSRVFTTSSCGVPNSPRESDPVGSKIQLAWSVNSAQMINLQWRPAGTSTWTLIQNLPTSSPTSNGQTTGFYQLTDLTPGTAYEWNVQRVCDETVRSSFTAPRTFTAICGSPEYLQEGQIQPTVAEVYWRAVYGISYRVQWRPKIPADSPWQTLPDKKMNSNGLLFAQFSDLAPGTAYEWQVMTLCSATNSSTFSSPRSFTTVCAPPVNFIQAYITSTSARVQWAAVSPETQYKVRWRRDNSTEWQEGAPTSNAYFDIAPLQTATLYRVQVQSICGGIPGSYSSDVLIGTWCFPPNSTYIRTTDITATSAQLHWAPFDSATSYEIQWRVAGTDSWPQSLTTSAMGAYTLPDLIPKTNYEWRIRTLCADSNVSDFSDNYPFTTSLKSVIYSVQAGSWMNPTTWSANRIPTSTDLVEIQHDVVIPANETGKSQSIQYKAGGKLRVSTNTKLFVN